MEDDPDLPMLARAAALFRAGELDQAEATYRQVVAASPHHVAAYADLASVLHARGQYELAIAALTQALQLAPTLVATQRNLVACIADWGLHLQRQGRLDDAIALHRKALAFDPNLVGAHNNLGAALLAQGHADAAADAFRAAIALDPTRADFQLNLGNALRERRKLDEAIACYRAALALDADYADAHLNLGSALLDQGRLDDALVEYDAAIARQPDLTRARTNRLLALAYDPAQTAQALHAAARTFAATLPTAAAPSRGHTRDDPERRLRLGYVSADFRFHPVGWFIQAPLVHRDRARFEVVCYANQIESDRLTDQLRGDADHWRDVATLSDDAFSAQVAADRIDILIDLAGHSAYNRLAALARRLAAVQASWIGFPMTTGVAAIDYLIADARMAPPGCEADFTETILRLPEVAWCYTPPVFAPPVSSAPALAAGAVTFGSFNNPAKLNSALLETWARVLAQVPGSRLLLKYRHLQGGGAAAHLRAAATAAGIADDRLLLEGGSPHPEALAAYAKIDIALDPFPFNGGTTTCEALWLGVPVISMAGTTLAGRMGASLVAAAGLPELVALDRDDYVARAVTLAHDPARLAELRGTLRRRMTASPLCDAPRFMVGFEAALRDAWRRHCTAENLE